jgi:DNA-directed RNA polymerase subunit RPC12/RpoP
MPANSIEVYCGTCGQLLDETTDISPEERNPCPYCGSFKRTVHVTISSKSVIYSKLGMKGRRPGGERPFIEQVIGDDLHRKTGIWMKFHRIIDRDCARYFEKVTNPQTREVVHHTDESLREHIDHGSAKKK